MESANTRLIATALGTALSPDANMVEGVDDDSLWDQAGKYLDPDAEITFPAPDGGFIGGMAGPFRGVTGFRAAWIEWVSPWEDFRIEVEELSEPESGTVLLLAIARGQLRGGMEIEQPSAAVYAVRDRRIVAIEHFLDQEQAKRAAGVET